MNTLPPTLPATNQVVPCFATNKHYKPGDVLFSLLGAPLLAVFGAVFFFLGIKFASLHSIYIVPLGGFMAFPGGRGFLAAFTPKYVYRECPMCRQLHNEHSFNGKCQTCGAEQGKVFVPQPPASGN